MYYSISRATWADLSLFGALSLVVVGLVVAGLIRTAIVQWRSRRALRRHFKKEGKKVARIEKFRGLLDLGPDHRRGRSVGYDVYLRPGGRRVPKEQQPRVFCVVKRSLLLGMVSGVEPWSDL
ncbi:hypothetical protein [Haloferula sp. BvORR071]|uniref:hypothetical protein n=1 Tax=Haloferula sp. BvORR071 TaxID=1396141 RepID=UPI00054D1871|nr:hypothetical protein [Haloferula sp. BvORR071]